MQGLIIASSDVAAAISSIISLLIVGAVIYVIIKCLRSRSRSVEVIKYEMKPFLARIKTKY